MLKKPSLKHFVWHGIDIKGFKIKGELSANNIQEAKLSLSAQKITLLKMNRQLKFSLSLNKNKIVTTDITDLIIELSTLISAGIPLLNSLQVIANSTPKTAVKNLIQYISKQIENGCSLSEALRSQPDYFDGLFVNLIYAGEQSGTLDIALNDIAVYREKIRTLKTNIKKALFYPAVVSTVAICVTCAMLIFVIPQFARLFQSVGATLPLLTRLVITVADFIHTNIITLFLIPFLLLLSIKISLQHFKSWQFFFDRYCLKLPLLGKILLAAIFARCFRTIATLLKAGLPLLDTLEITANIAKNKLYKQSFTAIHQQIKNGQTLTLALKNTRLFPARVMQMVSIGEESGQLDTMLKKLSVYFEEQVDNKIQNLSQLLEPVLMVILCGLIGILVIAIYLPIFRLGAVL